MNYELSYLVNGVKAGKYHYHIVKGRELPKTVNFGILNDFLTSEHPVDISINIAPVEDSKMLELLDMENETIEPEMNSRRRAQSWFKKLERKMESTRSLQEYIISGKGHIFQTSLSFYSKSENENESYNTMKYILWQAKKHLFNVYVPLFEHKKYFNSIFPFDRIDSKNYQYVHTHALATLFPFLVDYVDMEGGIFYGINDRNKTPVIFNRWDFPSSHSIISGTTGFGKSYFVKLSIIRELISDENTGIYIIDPLGEYTKLVRMLGGQTVELGKSGNSINIFETGDERSTEEKIFRLRTVFSVLLDLDKNDLVMIDAALSMVYLRNKNPTIRDFIDALKLLGDSRSTNLSYLLERLISGSLKSLDSDTFITVDKNIVSFDLSGINDELLTFYMVMVLNFIYGKISSNFEKKMVIVDETWKLLRNEYAAAFLDTMFRHVRRWKCSMNVISQKADDFLQSPHGKSMMNNALFHVIFKHGYISEEMKLFYDFTGSEMNYILNAEKPNISGYALAYFISHPLRFPLRIIATPEENEIITTDPDEIKELENV